ncbi:MAG: phosphoglycerate dehydrogenase [Candidatus Riflebacteria bacterium]|nr:phosphoglycerate dehydrogenase [Candidatus Riflebacteria bacterium]
MSLTILITTSSFGSETPEGLNLLKEHGFTVVMNPYGRKVSELELQKLLCDNQPVGILAGLETFSRQTLEMAKGYLKTISRVGVGWEAIDHEAAKDFGIKVFRTPGVLTQAVAELTIGLILAALRKIPYSDQKIREGKWEKTMGSLLFGKTVGIIGFGAIGRKVGELVKGFGTQVIFCDPAVDAETWAEKVTLNELLARADIISLHASGKNQILGEKEFRLLKKQGVIIVNTARGGLIDKSVLQGFLSEGTVGYACFDVFSNEPYEGPLRKCSNVILTPHIGSYAREARIMMEECAVNNLLQGLSQEKNI